MRLGGDRKRGASILVSTVNGTASEGRSKKFAESVRLNRQNGATICEKRFKWQPVREEGTEKEEGRGLNRIKSTPYNLRPQQKLK